MTIRLLPDGRVFSNRAATKIRRREQGWRYAAAGLERLGATPLQDDEDAAAWTRRWVTALTRPMRHHGNHRYVWGVNPSHPLRKYPKRDRLH